MLRRLTWRRYPQVRVWTPHRIQGGAERFFALRFRCFRVSGLLTQPYCGAAGLYGDRGSGPSRFGALEALGRSLVFPTPSSDRWPEPADSLAGRLISRAVPPSPFPRTFLGWTDGFSLPEGFIHLPTRTTKRTRKRKKNMEKTNEEKQAADATGRTEEERAYEAVHAGWGAALQPTPPHRTPPGKVRERPETSENYGRHPEKSKRESRN